MLVKYIKANEKLVVTEIKVVEIRSPCLCLPVIQLWSLGMLWSLRTLITEDTSVSCAKVKTRHDHFKTHLPHLWEVSPLYKEG